MSTSISSRSSSFPPTRQQLDELDALLQRMLDLPVNQIEETALDKAAEAARKKTPPAPPPEVPAEVEPPPDEEPAAEPAVIEVGAISETTQEEEAAAEDTPEVEPEPPVASESADPVPPQMDAAETASFTEEGIVSEPPAAPPAAEQEEWVPLRSSWKPSAQTWPPLVEHWQQAQSAPPVAPSSEYAPALAPSASAPPEPAPEPEPDPDPELPSLHTAITAAGTEASWLTAPLPPAEPEPLAEEAAGEPPWGLLPLVWFNQGFDACVQPLGPPGRWLASSGGKTLMGLLGLLSLGAAIALAVGDRIGWTW